MRELAQHQINPGMSFAVSGKQTLMLNGYTSIAKHRKCFPLN